MVTGGPCSGKTTLVTALAAAGHRTVPEAAIDVIERLNASMGAEGQRTWRSNNLAGFQRMVLDLQLERQASLAPGEDLVFLDRGIADGIAYFRNARLDPPRALVEHALASRYEHAFVLDTLDVFDRRRSSGRTSSRADSVKLGDLLESVYTEIGVPVSRVVLAPVPERILAILKAVRRLQG